MSDAVVSATSRLTQGVTSAGYAPRVLVGDTRSRTNVELIRGLGWGRMTCSFIDPYPGEPWGFDNGAFGCWLRRSEFDNRRFEYRMGRQTGTPYLAVLPDIVGRGLKSMKFSLEWLKRVRQDWPWYLAVQDGLTQQELKLALCGRLMEPHWKEPAVLPVAGLFLGGSDRFKRTAQNWRNAADDMGIKFHYGRAGTPRKVGYAIRCKADSFDSAFPLWTRERTALFVDIVTTLSPQQELAL